MQSCSIPIINAVEIHVLNSCINSSGYISLHMTLMHHTYHHINSTHMVNFMGIHKVVMNKDSVLVPGYCPYTHFVHCVDDLGKDCNVPVANALEILQSSNKPIGCMNLYLIKPLICHTYCHLNVTHMVKFMGVQ